MKLATDEEFAAHARAVRRGALEGGVVSTIAALGGSYYLHRAFPGYRQLPLSLKALGVVIVVAPIVSIQAERRGIEFDRSKWEGEGVRFLHAAETAQAQRWEELSTKDKLADWAGRHQYTLILGGWASSLAVAGAIISRDKLQTTPQKLVQARMWAQGLTIGLLIVAGALTHSKRMAAAEQPAGDHSWKDILEAQEEERQAAKEHTAPPTRRRITVGG
ncbi:putative hypoxia induced protein conserved region [Lyophyllum shimeji]|uniref:Hypoxia induced protein conserved region n=1 Tax=Lyophyllum shimeji TaxID=47721 RepID=A0A9P3UIE9_LYOSH|nr:putative hypoxia induced protein conserved region [Lyophyllum shimeji]